MDPGEGTHWGNWYNEDAVDPRTGRQTTARPAPASGASPDETTWGNWYATQQAQNRAEGGAAAGASPAPHLPLEVQRGIALVSRAVELDNSGGDPRGALQLYKDSIPIILCGLKDPSMHPETRVHIQGRVASYCSRAESLQLQLKEQEESQPLVQEAGALVERSLTAEAEEALHLLSQALELEMKAPSTPLIPLPP